MLLIDKGHVINHGAGGTQFGMQANFPLLQGLTIVQLPQLEPAGGAAGQQSIVGRVQPGADKGLASVGHLQTRIELARRQAVQLTLALGIGAEGETAFGVQTHQADAVFMLPATENGGVVGLP